VTLAPTFVGATSKSAETGLDGRYEIPALSPGEHLLYVAAERYTPHGGVRRADTTPVDVIGGQLVSGADVQLDRAGAISGRIFDVAGEGLPGVEVEVLLTWYQPAGRRVSPAGFAKTDALGLFRIGDLGPGEYYVRAFAPSGPTRVSNERRAMYADTYYPAVVTRDAALPLVVGPGQELAGIDYGLLAQEPVSVSGTIVSATGQPVGGTTVDLFRYAAASARVNDSVSTSEAGTFSFTAVLPGEYVIGVRTPRRGMVNHRFTVDGPVSDLVVVLQPGVRLLGQVLVQGTSRWPLGPDSPSRLRVMAVTWEDSGMSLQPPHATVEPSGSFVLENVVGAATLGFPGLPPGWTLAAVRRGGVDITDVPTVFSTGLGQPVDMVVTDRVTEIVGDVVDNRGRPVSAYTVVVFAEDPRRWTPASRSVRGSDARHGGAFRFDDLPPSDYLAVAVPSLPTGAWFDPEVLRLLRLRATRFRLSEGEHRTLRLELSPTPSGFAP
jgi:hypothetical protein